VLPCMSEFRLQADFTWRLNCDSASLRPENPVTVLQSAAESEFRRHGNEKQRSKTNWLLVTLN
jgi:hypothetical protein